MTTIDTSAQTRADEVLVPAPRPQKRSFLDSTPAKVLLPAIVLATAIGLWEISVQAGLVNPITVPAASDTFIALFEMMQTEYFWAATWLTLQETLLGFAVGSSLGLVIGALTGTFKVFRTAIWPFVVAFQNTPRVALAPVFLTWFGFGMTSKVVMAAVICFFPVVINTVAGLASVDDNARVLFRTYGASTPQTFFKLTLPTAAPISFAGIKTALTLALLGAIVGEFVGAAEGLGVLVKEFNFQLEVASGFAVVVFLAVIGLVLYGLIELLERRLITWQH
ncbi:ABC transporter permease [Marihabitans asiaticum]|uniref:NitT/TauT family transport system permease protein n=1 Tax=Marihabitans asiaticum TaxID=415218 RepID=A0A560WD32_9MICO|nr:ABC transporter permease [Marihabitans asiaticum]TWD15538.1 NitT/TauT family transport system permease protein [Marihabitans asiaticum]